MESFNQTESFLVLADEAFRCKNYNEAIQYYNKVLEVEINNHLAWFRKALAIGRTVLQEKGEGLTEFTEYAQKGIELAPLEQVQSMKIKFAIELDDVITNLIDYYHNEFISNTINGDTFDRFRSIIDIYTSWYIFAYEKIDTTNIDLLKHYIEGLKYALIKYKVSERRYLFLSEEGYNEYINRINSIVNSIKFIEPEFEPYIKNYKDWMDERVEIVPSDNASTYKPSAEVYMYIIGAAVLFAISLSLLFI